MSRANAVQFVPAHNEHQHLDAIHALFENYNRGAIAWEKIDVKIQATFCRLAGIKGRRVGMPISAFSELEVMKLLRTIKQVQQITTEFSHLSLSDFK